MKAHSGRLLAALAGSLAVFALGATLALALLPEWRAQISHRKAFFREKYRQDAERAGFRVEPGAPRIALSTWSGGRSEAVRNLGEALAGWLEATRSGLLVTVSHQVRRPGQEPADLKLGFALDGRLRRLDWIDRNASPLSTRRAPQAFLEQNQAFTRLFEVPGESLGARRGDEILAQSFERIDLRGSAPREHLLVAVTPPTAIQAEIRPGRADEVGGAKNEEIRSAFFRVLLSVPVVLAVGALFLALLLRARIDLVNGAVLAGVTLLAADLSWLTAGPASLFWRLLTPLISSPGKAIWVFFVWSAGESLLRSLRPDFTTSLDTLRLGRLGPRGGRALLVGFTAGAVLGGLRLAVEALALVLPGVAPVAASVAVPVFRASGSPLANGISLAAGVALAFALALRLMPARWAPAAAAFLAALLVGPIQLTPFPAQVVANLAVAGLLVWTLRRFGLTALLVAAVVSLLLPAALFSSLHLDWMPGTFALTGGLSLAVALLGFVGIARQEEAETGYVAPPAFVRRLKEERRLQHEVDLLGRMQLGLLPQEMPRVEGWDVAARSVLAGEAGGDLYDFLRDDGGHLWVAAGDVAGHGFPCAVAQAMIKAGLVSLAAPDESPAPVLTRLDRMLRGVDFEHSFTSLTLLRIAPVSGETLLANAGHPYPLLFAEGRVGEVAIPGFPLGQGPPRVYKDITLHLRPGSVLALCSDGLFEVLDGNGNAYGFERAREVFRVMGHRPALEIVDSLLNDCRRHLGDGELPDDITVVVVKRIA